MRSGLSSLTVIALTLLAICLYGTIACAQTNEDAPETLKPPADESLILSAHAIGDQVYSCVGSAWKLKEPDARLFDAKGQPVGRHFAGPSWEWKDGSLVKGKVAASVVSPDADSIPWLLVSAVDRSGTGVMTGVTSVQRLHTKGGKAPVTACDAANPEARAHYTADYFFFGRAK